MKRFQLKLAFAFVTSAFIASCGESSTSSGDEGGQSGSLAAMTILQGQLHVLEPNNIQSFSLEGDPLVPATLATTRLESFNGGETLFNFNNEYLFVGTELGVEIKRWQEQTEEAPQLFEHVDTVNHFQAYDPVVVHGNHAYFTTRDGEEAIASSSDLVAIVDISDISNSEVIFRYRGLNEPQGLAKHNDNLYVCDKAEGLIKFNIEEVNLADSEQTDANGNLITEETYGPGLTKIFQENVYPCNDIIAIEDRLILTGEHRITQLQLSEEGLDVLSVIEKQ